MAYKQILSNGISCATTEVWEAEMKMEETSVIDVSDKILQKM